MTDSAEDKAARPYDIVNHWEGVYSAGGALPWDLTELPAEVSSCAEHLSPGQSVLDLGCGRGQIAVALAKKGFDVTGIDISAGAVAAARQRASDAGVRARFQVADVRKFRSVRRFDLVIDYSVFHHLALDAREEYASVVMSALASEGRYVVVCYSDADSAAGGRAMRIGDMGNPIYHPSAADVSLLFAGLEVQHYGEARLGNSRQHLAHHFVFSRNDGRTS